MNNNQSSGDLSYMTTMLKAFLNESHPQLAQDAAFIQSRSEIAEEVYEQSIRQGHTVFRAVEMATHVLFESLHFSKFNTLVELIAEQFPEIPELEVREFALKMLPVCEETFQKYPISDNFISLPEFEDLRTELIGTIVIWMEDNGIF